ncbi:uncharacterized protein A4U43_C10F5290 [Asparagus officinalis]|uniref:Uncharacterized protein n=1 Tax=Asparagus officinalis TaxID=4686 RepID=A0A5P1E2M1_ASPOF|nr:uncharacterized protein A4U43_C10F5290 [Asparagus officinalis]
MGVLRDNSSWCFCSGGGKSERVQGGIFSGKSPAMASISGGGTGFLIHRSLLLTTHAKIPRRRRRRRRFFITSSVLDLTIVGLDTVDTDSTSQQGHQPHYLKTCSNPNLDLGSKVYLLGHTDKKYELMVGEGKVVIATDNLIKLSTDGISWCPGSAGFDVQGNLAFMICDPMKLGTSLIAKSSTSASSSSSLSWKNDSPVQFGIPIPIICDWLYQHWEGNLNELSKPKLPLIRLMSSGHKSEHLSASFTQRRVFKDTKGEADDFLSSSHIASKPRFPLGSNNSSNGNASHEQGIPTPEIFESPKLTSGPVRKTEIIPRVTRSIVLPLPLKQLFMDSEANNIEESKSRNLASENSNEGDCCSEVMSSSSPLEASAVQNDADGFSSGEETMYSAETMESRNFPSPKGNKFQQVGRSQSCVNSNRWGSTQRNSSARKGAALQKQQSMIPMRRTRSHGLPQRSHDYFSPTVSSTMKKRNSSEQSLRPRQTAPQASPRVMIR